MIRGYIPALLDSDFSSKRDMRMGDCTIISDSDGNVDVIDGYCGSAAKRVISRLKERRVKSPYLHITHPHYDHRDGIRRIIEDDWFAPRALHCPDPASYNKGFSNACREDVEALEKIISKARAKKIPVIYLKDGDYISHGDIDFKVYRDQPKTASNTDSYLNDGSLCYYFPKLYYLTTGDTGAACAKKHNLKVLFVKGGHHGNFLLMIDARWLKGNGCRFYWDNDYSTVLTDFLMTGRDNAIDVGLEVLNVHGDINFVSYGGKTVIYKGSEHWSYKCPYTGKLELKTADLPVVKSVLKGTFGNGDTRITNLLDHGYAPSSVQTQVNDIIKLVRG